MGIDAAELKNQARKLTAAGKHEKAARVLKQLVELEPRNPRWPHKLGEIQRRMNNTDESIGAFHCAAELYARGGFLLKAIALCKVILGIDPQHEETQEMLAELAAERQEQAVVPLTPHLPGAAAEVESAEPPPPSVPAEPAMAAIEAASAGMQPLSLSDLVRETTGEQPQQPPPQRRQRRTIPPGEALEALELHKAVPEAQRSAALEQSDVFEIPLDDGELEDLLVAVEPTPDAAAQIVEQLSTPLFTSLDKPALRMLIERVDIRMCAAGERIVVQGTPGTSLYVLVEGAVAVYREGPPRRALSRLEEGAFFGEIALVTKLERSATVEAATDCVVLEISREVIGDLIEDHPAMLKVLLRFFRERLINTLVETHDLFAAFSGPDRKQLVKRFAFIEAPAGATLVKQGTPTDGLYLLLAGLAERSRGDRPAKTIGSGAIFGERSLLGGGTALASVRTKTKCWLFKLDERVFREVIMTHPHVLAVVSEIRRTGEFRAVSVEGGEGLPVL